MITSHRRASDKAYSKSKSSSNSSNSTGKSLIGKASGDEYKIAFSPQVTASQQSQVRALLADAALQSPAFLCATELCNLLKGRAHFATAVIDKAGAAATAEVAAEAAEAKEIAEAAATIQQLEQHLEHHPALKREDRVFVLVFAAVKAGAVVNHDGIPCGVSRGPQLLLSCLKKHKLALRELVADNEELQRQLIVTVGWLVAVWEPQLSRFFADVLKWLYDEGLVEEGPLYDWNKKARRFKASVLSWIKHDELDALLGAAAPLLTWLQEAEEMAIGSVQPEEEKKEEELSVDSNTLKKHEPVDKCIVEDYSHVADQQDSVHVAGQQVFSHVADRQDSSDIASINNSSHPAHLVLYPPLGSAPQSATPSTWSTNSSLVFERHTPVPAQHLLPIASC